MLCTHSITLQTTWCCQLPGSCQLILAGWGGAGGDIIFTSRENKMGVSSRFPPTGCDAAPFEMFERLQGVMCSNALMMLV